MTAVQIVPAGEGGSYQATIDGKTIPVVGYLAENGDNGKVVVSLLIAADALQIGIPPRRQSDLEQTRTMNAPARGVWGDPSAPDPRANVPGWVPPPATVDAGRERVGEHRQVGRFQAALGNLVRGRRLA